MAESREQFSHSEFSEHFHGNGGSLPPLSPLQDAVRIMAKDLVRTRRYVRKFVLMRANIQAVSLKIQTLKSNNSMAQAMKGVTKAMGTMNRQVCLSPNPPLPAPTSGTILILPPLAAEIAPDPEDHDGV